MEDVEMYMGLVIEDYRVVGKLSGQLKILLVEDNEDFCLYLFYILGKCYELEIKFNGVEVFEYFELY